MHAQEDRKNVIERKEAKRQTGISDSSGEWHRSPHKAKVNSSVSPSITEQLRMGGEWYGGDIPLSAIYMCDEMKEGW